MYLPPSQHQPQVIIVKQNINIVPLHLLGTDPASIVCPLCQNNITTIVEKTCNWVDLILFGYFWIVWLILKAVKRKNICCMNATHSCPECGQIIGNYNSLY